MNYPVRQGATPPLVFIIEGHDLTDKTVRMTFCAQGKEIMVKENDDLYITYDGGVSTIVMRLTQEETLNLPLGSVQVQAKWIGQDGDVPVTSMGEFDVAPGLDKKVIKYNRGDNDA